MLFDVKESKKFYDKGKCLKIGILCNGTKVGQVWRNCNAPEQKCFLLIESSDFHKIFHGDTQLNGLEHDREK